MRPHIEKKRKKNPDWSENYVYAPTRNPHPFPGMDPFVESFRWATTHHAMAEAITEFILKQLPSDFTASCEDGVSVLEPLRYPPIDVQGVHGRLPDSYVARHHHDKETAIATVPVSVLSPDSLYESESNTQVSIILISPSGEIVTWIELISPNNKQYNGLREYLEKRKEILSSRASLLEIDLVHHNGRLPEAESLDSRYYALLNQPDRRSQFLRFKIPLQQRMRTIKVPVLDATFNLDLQEIFNIVYARRCLNTLVDYDDMSTCGLSDEDAAWAMGKVKEWRAAGNKDKGLLMRT